MGGRRFGSRVLMRFRIDLALVEFSDVSNTPDMRLLRVEKTSMITVYE